MQFLRSDFEILNISNIPNSEEKLKRLIMIFKDQSFSYEELITQDIPSKLGYKTDSFRKMINHSSKVGFLQFNDKGYALSELSYNYYLGKLEFKDYIFNVVQNNKEIFSVLRIIILLLKIFSFSLHLNTLYVLFSLISKSRTDQSSLASVGRNLRAYFSLLNMMGKIMKKKDKLMLLEVPFREGFDVKYVNSISMEFSQDIINVKLITNYLCNFFDTNTTNDILSCISTYEHDNYIWAKSSLFKNQGEIKNLHGEYIMTVIIKER